MQDFCPSGCLPGCFPAVSPRGGQEGWDWEALPGGGDTSSGCVRPWSQSSNHVQRAALFFFFLTISSVLILCRKQHQ